MSISLSFGKAKRRRSDVTASRSDKSVTNTDICPTGHLTSATHYCLTSSCHPKSVVSALKMTGCPHRVSLQLHVTHTTRDVCHVLRNLPNLKYTKFRSGLMRHAAIVIPFCQLNVVVMYIQAYGILTFILSFEYRSTERCEWKKNHSCFYFPPSFRFVAEYRQVDKIKW